MCNSDGHKGTAWGRRAWVLVSLGLPVVLTCVLAGELSRVDVWEALCSRRCYGHNWCAHTSRCTDSGCAHGGRWCKMWTRWIFASRVVGAAPLEALQVYRGRELITEVQPPEFRDLGAFQQGAPDVVWLADARARAAGGLVWGYPHYSGDYCGGDYG